MKSTTSFDPSQLAEVTRAMSACVPELTVTSTVGIVAAKAPVIRQLGTGTLLAIAEHRFVVTAAHVIREASQDALTLGISGGTNGQFIATGGTWILSGDQPSDGRCDVALYELDKEQCCRLTDVDFIRIADVAFTEDLSTGFFVLTGFPTMWSTTINGSDDLMKSKLLQYGTYALEGSTAGLLDYNPIHHFLLEATPAELLDHTGEPTTFRTRTGFSAKIPNDLLGVSGCSVWMIGNLNKPVETWTKADSRLVGIETAVYSTRGAIKVTRWSAITTMLYNAVPALRPVIEMYANLR